MIPGFSHLRWLVGLGISICTLSLILLLAVLALITTGFHGSSLEQAENTDCLLVFGAAVWGREGVSPAIERRIETAADLSQRWNVNRIVLSGGKGSSFQVSEAEVMRRYGLLQGMDPEVIILEDQSSSTVENLRNSKPLLEECDQIVGVSDRIHLYRIRFLAGLQEFGRLSTYPADRAPLPKTEMMYLAREAVAVLYYFGMNLREYWM